jgi:hypothetical protein
MDLPFWGMDWKQTPPYTGLAAPTPGRTILNPR